MGEIIRCLWGTDISLSLGVLQVHLSCNMLQNFLPFKGWIIFHCMYNHIFLIHSSIDGHLDCFRVLPVMTSAAVNPGIQISLQDPAFNSLKYISRIQGHSIVLFLIFWSTSILFSTVAVLFYFPTNNAQGFQFLHILPITFCFLGCFS